MDLKYTLSLAELIDRMNIVELKIVHASTPEAKQGFYDEMQLILHDINEHGVSGSFIRAIAALSMINVTIWDNEDFMRKQVEGKELTLEEKAKAAEILIKTHKSNADRSAAKAAIQRIVKGRIDTKLNYISGLWNINWE